MEASDDERKRKIMATILDKASSHESRWAEDPFEVLVGTIISQNTNDRNTEKAMQKLKAEVGMTPDSILSASKKSIVECLKPAGLYNVKAPRIIQLAKTIKEEVGDPDRLNNMSREEVKGLLSKVDGVGPKTLDIFLAFTGKEAVIPVDTHIKRVAKRLGLAGDKDGYHQIREKLQRLIPAEDRLKAHFALIAFGRRVCKAKKPECLSCQLSKYCPSREIFYPDR
jgi:endonuclease-3